MDEKTKEEIRGLIREELGQFLRSDRYTFHKPIKMVDGVGIEFGRGTGTRLGLSTSDRLAFYNATPVIRQAILTAVNNSTIDLTYGAEERDVITNNRNRIQDIEARLQTYGLIPS